MTNTTIEQYIQQNTQGSETVLEHVKPVNSFAGKQMDIKAMPYANVKYCIRLLMNANDWKVIQQLFEICFDVNEETFWKASIVEFFKAKKFLTDEFKNLIAIENKIMASQSTDEHLWKIAGADRLKPYNDTLPLVQLGKLFGQYPFDLGRKPYSEIFSLLAQVKIQNDVETEYQKLKS